MIVGEQDAVETVTLLETDNIETLMERVAAAIRRVDGGEGVLVMVDLFGASPFNAAARLAMERPDVEVIAGMGLPMLVESLVQRDGAVLEDLVETAHQAGTSGVRTLSATLDQSRR